MANLVDLVETNKSLDWMMMLPWQKMKIINIYIYIYMIILNYIMLQCYVILHYIILHCIIILY